MTVRAPMAKKSKPPKPPKYDGIVVTRHTTEEGYTYCQDKTGRICFDSENPQRVVLEKDLRRIAAGLHPGQLGWTVPSALDAYTSAMVQFDNGPLLKVAAWDVRCVAPDAAGRISEGLLSEHRGTPYDADPVVGEELRRKEIHRACGDVVDFSQVQEGGDGSQEIYAFSFQSLRRLAQFEQRPHYPVKIGYTADRDYGAALRVRGFVMEKAGYPERVQLLLVWRTPNGRGLETAIHRWLKAEGRQMREAMSREWFHTNAAEVLGLCQTLPPVPIGQLPALKEPNRGPVTLSVQPDGSMKWDGPGAEE